LREEDLEKSDARLGNIQYPVPKKKKKDKL
jgi:hypothetical protein